MSCLLCQTLDVSHASFELLLLVAARVPSSDTKVPQQEGCRITELTSQVCLWLADWAVTISTGHRTRAPPHLYYSSGPGSSGLPSALSALEALEGPPSYLTPEATRPLASSAYHGRLVQAAGTKCRFTLRQ